MTTTGAAVLGVLDLLRGGDIDVWVDGGWGVDALLGHQTRSHNDLDIAVRLQDRARYDEAMAGAGFRNVRDDGPYNTVVRDDTGCEVDAHFVDLDETYVDERGVEVYRGIAYEAGSLRGRGIVLGYPVRCVTPEALVRYHTGYEPDDDDYRDVAALCRRFKLPLPPPFDTWPR